MDILSEQQMLMNSSAEDFIVTERLGAGKHGLVVKAKLKGKSLDKYFAVKLLFNFTHEYTSVISNKFENEWIILSRLLPHPNVVRYWSQFISPISESFIPHIPNDIRHMVARKKSVSEAAAGKTSYRNGQFLVFDCYSGTLPQWLSENRSFGNCSPSVLIKFCSDLLRAVKYLEDHNICHLDLKPDNLLLSADAESVVLCDFGCAIQFQSGDFELQWVHGMQVGGNRAHLSPEVLTEHMLCRTDPNHKTIHYKRQEAFAVGVLIHEIITGEHPLDDYPLAYTQNQDGSSNVVSFLSSAVNIQVPLPPLYPSKFHQLIENLVNSDPAERTSISTALYELESLMDDTKSVFNKTPLDLEKKIQLLEREKTLAEEFIKHVADERDQAIKEMKGMVEQCQEIALEFDTLAKEYEAAKRQIHELRKEKKAVEKASDGAFQAYNMVKEQLDLITRERDIARSQVDGLRQLCSRIKQDSVDIRECVRCKMFLLSMENNDKSACCWHKGVGIMVVYNLHTATNTLF